MAALLIATGAGVFVALWRLLATRFDETLTAKARALITASEIDGKEFEIDLIVHEFAGFGAGGDDFFEIRRLNGGIFMRSPSLEDDSQDAPGIGSVAPPRNDRPQLSHGKLGDGRLARFYISRLYPKGDKKGRHQDLYLIVASPTAGLHWQLMLLATVLASTGGAALLLMVPTIRYSLGRGLRPLDRLAEDVARLRPENLHERLEPGMFPPELQPVAVRLNDWLARLEASFERERRFSSHAAHELRTPLAALKSMAELGAMWPDETTPEHMASMVVLTNELTALLEKLSLLSRADAGTVSVELTKVGIQPSLDAVLARVESKAAARGVVLTTALAEADVLTDPVLWNAILQNLIDNAVSHSPTGSLVSIEIGPGRLVVTNPAPELSESDLPHLFEKFWRKDPARGDDAHTGLGLSIVRASTRLLDWDCMAELTPDHQLRMVVRWGLRT
jgi:signal transduction histidine kinase